MTSTEQHAALPQPEPTGPAPVLLLAPRDGTPEVVADAPGLARVIAAFSAGTGPVAVDAERASGYTYSQRAYLVQLRRAGAGSAMIDPLGCPDLTALGQAVGEAEWVLHAASQDLACLAEIGLRPHRIFDTELAGRLAGFDRVGLGTMVEKVLGFTLEKGHSAANWSTRPLPEPWLRYAALDVELLIELRAALAEILHTQGKTVWAEQEFAAVLAAPPAPPRVEPWRRLAGLHKVRGAPQLAVARALWEARDAQARSRDIAPGRILPDGAIVAATLATPASVAELCTLPVFGGPRMRRSAGMWWSAIAAARALPEAALPAPALANDGPPQSGRWAERDPVAAARLVRLREALAVIADEHRLPAENLLEPALTRRLAWTPPEPLGFETVLEALRSGGARPWQIGLTAEAVSTALAPPLGR